MSFPYLTITSYLFFFLKKESDRFFISVAIRAFAFGMIAIYIPIYIYEYFNSLSLSFLFFAGIYGLHGILVPFGGKAMMKFGIKKTMLLSYPFFLGFYICLFFFDKSIFFVPLSIILYGLGMVLFWPAYHISFIQVSETKKIGKEVGKLNFVVALPGILAPFIGGVIISFFGFATLFVAVLCVLISSAIPLFLSRDIHQHYSDTYLGVYKRIFKKQNRYYNLAFISQGLETLINIRVWPLFLIISSIGYLAVGSITTISLAVSLLFTLYMGRITDRVSKTKLLAIGSVLTSGAWIGKFFVIGSASAFLAQSFYRFARTSAEIPMQSLVYEKAKNKGEELDEFIIYRDMVIGISRCFFLIILASIFYILPNVNIAFLLAAVFSLGFMFLGKIPEIKSWFAK